MIKGKLLVWGIKNCEENHAHVVLFLQTAGSFILLFLALLVKRLNVCVEVFLITNLRKSFIKEVERILRFVFSSKRSDGKFYQREKCWLNLFPSMLKLLSLSNSINSKLWIWSIILLQNHTHDWAEKKYARQDMKLNYTQFSAQQIFI